ncbi:hypothetical protein V8E36_004893 [Tilletia maclaganii]
MPTTPRRPAHLLGDPFSSPALTSPADDVPAPARGSKLHQHLGTDIDADGDYTLDSIHSSSTDEDEAAHDREAAAEDRRERAQDGDYEEDDHVLSSPAKDESSISRFFQHQPHAVTSSPASASGGVDLLSSPVQTQMSAKEMRASQLAQIRAAKKARDLAAASPRESPAPSGTLVSAAPSSSGTTVAQTLSQSSDRKRKASEGDAVVEGGSAPSKKRKAEAEAESSSERPPRDRTLSTGSSLSSLSDADAEGSVDNDALAPSPGQAPKVSSSPPLSSEAPSLADAFAAAKGNPAESSSSKLAPEPRVNVEVERTRARRMQSLWPDRSLDQCIEALRRSEWNVSKAMELLQSVKPEGSSPAPNRVAPFQTNGPAAGAGAVAGRGANGHAQVPSSVVPKPATVGKRPIPRGAIMLGGAKKAGTSAAAPGPSSAGVTMVRPQDIPPAARASALQQLSERDSVSSDSSQELPTVAAMLAASKIARNGATTSAKASGSVSNGSGSASASLAASALQARRAAEEAERARAAELKRINKAKRKAEEEEKMAALDGDDNEGSGMDEAEREAMQEETALQWFNTCDETALMDTVGCNAAQAAGIVALRPFHSVADVNARLGDKKVKGITPRLFHNCIELMAGYYEVDTILAKCEKVGRMLQDAMADWDPVYLQQIGGTGDRAGSGSVTVPGSRAGTPLPSSGSKAAANATIGAASPLQRNIKLDSGTAAEGANGKAGESSATAAAAAAAGQNDGSGSTSPVRSAVADGKRKAWLSDQPVGLAPGVVLKDYQLAGLNWLSLLYEKKMSCILADEMGLGKTVQVISFFTHVKALGEPGPHLVVVPSSVLENWMREFRTFAPDLVVVKYYGSQREREELRMDLRDSNDFDVMLTTYDMAAGGPNDHAFLRKRGFDACVYDEGHVLKSRKSQKYEKLMRIRARWRLLLTGTPLQNNLQELVSLLNFIMPTYFSSAEEALSAIFKVKASAQKNELSQQRIVRAKKMMQPFVLRRRKDKVLTDLRTKTERIEYCEMTRPQKKLYNEALSRSRAALIEQESATKTRSAAAKRKANTSSHVLMDLRKAANHPLLFRTIFNENKIAAMAKDYIQEPDNADEKIEDVKADFAINSDAQLSLTAHAWPCTRKHVLPNHEWMNSGKVKVLQRLLQDIKAQGDRAIIFSQFTTVLDILCVCLEIMGISFVGFTGATDVGDRQELVDQFTNDPSISVFLLSTKAGGLGINLVAANWVILFDQDFNPQNDKQAADRAYRIGQKKEVHVVRLISKGTIDEDILRLGQRKLELENRVAGGDDDEEDGDEVEEKVQRSLLTQLRDRVEDADDAGTGAADSPAPS